MSEKNKKRQVAKISVFTASIFVILFSVTYAFITQVIIGEKNLVLQAGTLSLRLEEHSEITITDAFPMYDEVGMIQEESYNFELFNDGSVDTNYKLIMTPVETGTLALSDIRYGLIKDGEKTIDYLSNLTDYIIDEGTIAGGDSYSYSLRLWIRDDLTEITQVQNKFMSFKMNLDVKQKTEEIKIGKPLYDEVVNSYNNTDQITINFSEISSTTNGLGVYKFQENATDIFYYRGAVENNNVIFADYCWQMVRTTKTSGIKMIYNGKVIDPITDENGNIIGGKCTNTGEASQLKEISAFNAGYNYGDNAYIGYMYGLIDVETELSNPQCIKKNSEDTQAEIGTETTKETCEQAGGKWATTAYESTHANVRDSEIKTTIDTWFSASSLNTQENLKKIEDAVYCNDRSIDPTAGSANGYTGYTTLGYGTNKTNYNANARIGHNITNPQPSLECANVNDRFTISKENGNGDLTYPTGLLTSDEMVLAGGVYNTTNSDYYLYTGESYWSISPFEYAGGRSYEFNIYSDGRLDSTSTNNVNQLPYGVRPSISLTSTVTYIDGGTGTKENPFVIE